MINEELPQVIRPLDKCVVDRIAAGEVIQRPANAIKELIENALDARATQIQIRVSAGGFGSIQISDNGTGICRESLPIVCERFTTSKLETFADLNGIATFGFRGEALASISHVAHLTILTKTRSDKCAYQVKYLDGKPKNDPVPMAGNQGTRITIENLFYNVSMRQVLAKNTNDEYRRIHEIVRKYAVHNARVGFVLKKSENTVELSTIANSTIPKNIRVLYDARIARALLEIDECDEQLKFKLNGYITTPNYTGKKLIFLLFINNRLVESANLKKVVDEVYGAYLPRNEKPFVYLHLQIDPQHLDVNVHPTKHEVIFLHETEIVDRVRVAIENRLVDSNRTRTFYVQTKVPDVFRFDAAENNKRSETVSKKGSQTPIADKDLKRTDSQLRKLENCRGHESRFEMSATKLKSVRQLREQIRLRFETKIAAMFADSIFIGSIDFDYFLIQFETKLFFCNCRQILGEYFYQKTLFAFQNLQILTFDVPLKIDELLGLLPEQIDLSGICKRLYEFSEMLLDYFSIEIDKTNGVLKGLPVLINDFIPEMANLPKFLHDLVVNVNWKNESKCIDGIAREIGHYYASFSSSNTIENTNWKWLLEFIIYPELKTNFYPANGLVETGAILQIADLPNLYTIFERC